MALAQAGCNDFATPAELTAPTVVGIIAEPPVVRRGASTVLTPLIASPEGPLAPAGARWTLAETLPGVPPFGQLTARADGSVSYRAPEVLPELPPNAPPLDSVQLELTLDGRATATLKAVLVADVTTQNPTITELAADGVALSAAEDATLEVAAGAQIALSVTTSPSAGASARFAWYASLGTVEDYQSSSCTFVAGDPGAGWLFVVVRDGQLGVAWRAVRLVVK